jgi:integrase
MTGNSAGKGKVKTKYFVRDDEFYLKMRAECRTLLEQGAIRILELTGCHTKSLVSFLPEDLTKEGGTWFLSWKAPKKQRKRRNLRAPIPQRDVDIIAEWLKRYGGKRTERHLYRVVNDVAKRSGFPNVSAMSYRHTRIVRLMTKFDGDVRKVSHLCGATFDTIEAHYSQADPGLYEDEELVDEIEKREDPK